MASYQDEVQLRELVVNYLRGNKNDSKYEIYHIDEIRSDLRKLAKDQRCKKLYQDIKLCDGIGKDAIPHANTTKLLEKLNIRRDTDAYDDLILSPNLYSLLNKLRSQGHEHLKFLIDIIDETNPPFKITYYLIGGVIISAATGLFLYFKPAYFWGIIDWFANLLPKIWQWVDHILFQLKNVPLIGMSWQGLMLGWYWYHTFKYGTDPSWEQVRQLMFQTVGILLNIAAHLISYLQYGAMAALPGFLFIASSFIDVLESIYTLTVRYKEQQVDLMKSLRSFQIYFKEVVVIENNNTIDAKANATRCAIIHDRDLNILWVKLAAASLITISVVLWCTLQPSIGLTLSCMIFGWFVALAKDSIIKTINERYANEMQAAVSVVYAREKRYAANDERYRQEQIRQDKKKFDDYASPLIVDEVRNKNSRVAEILTAKKDELMSNPDFSLELARLVFDTSVEIAKKFTRLLSKPAVESEVREDSERRTGVYMPVHEDSSTESTKQFASAVGFGKKSTENSAPKPFAIKTHRRAAFFRHVSTQENEQPPGKLEKQKSVRFNPGQIKPNNSIVDHRSTLYSRTQSAGSISKAPGTSSGLLYMASTRKKGLR